MKRLALLLLLGGCSTQHAETARYGLSVFCAAHDAGIISILNTPALQTAGYKVCKAAGHQFGNPPMAEEGERG